MMEHSTINILTTDTPNVGFYHYQVGLMINKTSQGDLYGSSLI